MSASWLARRSRRVLPIPELPGSYVMPTSKNRVLRELSEVVDPSHTALIVVDVQNDFVSKDGFIAKFGLDVSDMQAAIPRINDFIRVCRAIGVPVIYLQEVI